MDVNENQEGAVVAPVHRRNGWARYGKGGFYRGQVEDVAERVLIIMVCCSLETTWDFDPLEIDVRSSL